MGMFYTYVWKDEAGVPFYVGKGSGGRSNFLWNRSPEFLDIYSAGNCTVEIEDEFIHESQAHAHEMELIDKFGRREFGGLLVNKTDGGEGTSGWVPTAEQRAKIGAAHKGKSISPEHRAALSRAHKGKTMSASARERIGNAARGRPKSAETREKLRLVNLGRKQSAETLAKLSVIRTGKKQTPESSIKKSTANRLAPPRADNKSGFKGVSLEKRRGTWNAEITVSNGRMRLGSFSTAEQAAHAYDEAAFAAFGTDCYMNFPTEAKAS